MNSVIFLYPLDPMYPIMAFNKLGYVSNNLD